VLVTWRGVDPNGTGIERYEVARSTDGGKTWTTLSRLRDYAWSLWESVRASGTVRFRVRATDGTGNTGAWVTSRLVTPRLVQSSSTTVRYAGRWRTGTGAAYSGGSTRFAKTAGASATYAFTGRSVGLVTTLGPTRGEVRIYVNGRYNATVDLNSPYTRHQVIAWQRTWASTGSRTIRLVVAGTPGHPRVDLDAFAVLK
jgi:hypothetical protein